MTKGRGKMPGMGGLDKHLKREAHKERAQLPSRQRLGALEKHKDYVKRAKRRHEKDAKVLQLKRAAAQRNPDEFNQKMTERILDPATGKMKSRRGKNSSDNVAAEREKQLSEFRKSAKYLAHKEETDHKRVVDIFDDVIGLDAKPQNTHTVFVDDDDEARAFNAVEHFGATRAMLANPARRVNLRKVAHEAPALHEQEADDIEALGRARRAVETVEDDDANAAEQEEGEEGAGSSSGAARDDPKLQFAERVKAARAEVARERRESELEARRQAALKMREAAERRRRGTQLHEMNASLRRRTKAMVEKTKRKASAKYKPGTQVRQR